MKVEQYDTVISDLLSSLLEFQKRVRTIAKSEENPFFKSKYADLASIDAVIRPILSDLGLVLLQPASTAFNNEGALTGVTIQTIIIHAASGCSFSETFTLPMSKLDAQEAGKGVTYARRYALSSFINIITDEDDDGNSASGKGKSGTAKGGGATTKEARDIFANSEGLTPAAVAAPFIDGMSTVAELERWYSVAVKSNKTLSKKDKDSIIALLGARKQVIQKEETAGAAAEEEDDGEA